MSATAASASALAPQRARLPARGRGARFFSFGGAALCVGGVLVAGLAAGALGAVPFGEDASVQGLSVRTLLAAGGILLAAGFLAALAARKLCVLEVAAASLFAFALSQVPWIFVVWRERPWAMAIDPQTYETWAVVATLLLGIVLFLGSSLGFMLAGSGELDLGFRYEGFVALTFLRLRGKGRGGRRFSPSAVVTLIAILAVVIGAMSLTVVLSVMSGFEQDLKHKILGTNAHAIVQKYGNDFTDYPEVRQKILSVPGVIGATPFTLNEVMISSESNLSGVVLKGIDPQTSGTVTDVGKDVEDGKLSWLDDPAKIPVEASDGDLGKMTDRLNKLLDEEDQLAGRKGAAKQPHVEVPKAPPPAAKAPAGPLLPGVVIGRELAHSLRVFVGDTVHVVSPLSNELGPTGPIPKSRPFRVAGIFYSGMYEYDAKFAYIALPEAQKYFEMKGAVTGLEIKVTDIDAVRRITKDILFKLDGYPFHTKDWSEMNHNLFAALAMEKLVMAFILGFASLPVGFLILAILMFLAFEKSKEIAVLKSMGARDQSVMKVFVLEGLIIGGVGAVLGLAVGLLVCFFISRGAIKLDPSVYYIESLPVRIEGWQISLVALSAIVLSYLATIYPALAASRLAPVEGLRNE
ncbi:MAG: FtsX-like permease family protein [Myxococcales bacterium]